MTSKVASPSNSSASAKDAAVRISLTFSIAFSVIDRASQNSGWSSTIRADLIFWGMSSLGMAGWPLCA